jgi:2-polyprenyl-3-methyl-5-hydroxy-6-metoxy-1,4-benzoquinol methylase
VSEEALRRSWDANAAAWTRTVREGGIESRRLVTDAAVVDAVLALAPSRVLDVGTGEGWLARALAERGLDVVGFDRSEALIASAREAGGAPRFERVGYDDFADDPTRWGEFDVVVCNFALLGESIGPALRACGEALGPGGRLVIQTVHPFAANGDAPYRDGWREETFHGMGSDFEATMPWYFRTLGSWVRELSGAGLAVVDIREPAYPGSDAEPASLILVGSVHATREPGKGAP